MSSYEAESQAKQNNDNVLGLLRVFSTSTIWAWKNSPACFG